MAVLTLPTDKAAAATLLPAGSALHLRRRGEQEVRTIPLAADKLTIGSSPRCHVRLPASEAQPLQCLLTLEAGAATVTRWAAGVLLNGREFTKAAMKCGDRLAIGDWEIGLNGFSAETPRGGGETKNAPRQRAPERAKPPLGRELGAKRQAAQATPVVVANERDPRLARVQAFGDRVVLELWKANQAARERAKSLLSALRAARLDFDAAVSTFEVRETALEEALAAATAARADASAPEARKQAAWEAAELECNALRRRLESHAEAIEELRAQVAAAAAAQQRAEDEGRRQMRAAEQSAAEVARLEAELQSLRGRDAGQRDADDAERAQLLAERDQTSAELAELAAERTQLRAERDALAVECDGLRKLLETTATSQECEPEAPASKLDVQAEEFTRQAPSESLESAQPPLGSEVGVERQAAEAAPVSFIEKYRHLLEEDDDADAEPARRPALLDDEFLSPAKARTCPAPDDDSDEALEAYMSGMMQRLRGAATSPALESVWTPSVEPTMAEEPTTIEPAPSDPVEFTPLKHATRKAPASADLATLREIANTSARTAIASHHARRRHESAVGRKFLVAAAAALSAGYVLSSAPGIGTGWFWAGIFAAGVAAVAALQAVLAERRVRAARRMATGGVSAEHFAGGAGGEAFGALSRADAPARD